MAFSREILQGTTEHSGSTNDKSDDITSCLSCKASKGMLDCEPILDLVSCFCTKEFSSGATSADSERKLVSPTKNFGILLGLFCFNFAEASPSLHEWKRMQN
jgi:hypothetical protein